MQTNPSWPTEKRKLQGVRGPGLLEGMGSRGAFLVPCSHCHHISDLSRDLPQRIPRSHRENVFLLSMASPSKDESRGLSLREQRGQLRDSSGLLGSLALSRRQNLPACLSQRMKPFPR